jgi:hypothetical protein
MTKHWYDGITVRAATRCTQDDHDNCVNIGSAGGRVAIVDSKQANLPMDLGPVIDVSAGTFRTFLADVA